MIPTPFRKAARTIGAVGIGLAVVAGSALAQFAPANNGTLSTRMRWVQFEIVGGRIVASSVHVGANMNSSTNANGRVEKIQIDLTGTAPDIHYELLDKADTVRLDVNDGDDFALRSQKKQGDTEHAVEFTQVPGKDLTLTIDDGHEKRTTTAPTLWHLLLDDPEVTRNQLAPALELLKPGWQLASMAEAVEDALYQSARLHRTDDRTRWAEWVQQLSSIHYADRLAAERRILGAGREILPFLRGLNRDLLDAEQWRRIRNVIEALDQSQADSVEQTVSLLAGDVRAWLPLLGRKDELKRQLALEQIKLITGGPVEFDPKAAPEVRERQLEQLRERFSPAPATDQPSPNENK